MPNTYCNDTESHIAQYAVFIDTQINQMTLRSLTWQLHSCTPNLSYKVPPHHVTSLTQLRS